MSMAPSFNFIAHVWLVEMDQNDNIKYSKCMLCSPDYLETDKTCNMDKGK